jgi:uncharacterized protein (DUF433 family)
MSIPPPKFVPIRVDEHGIIRVGNTRVTFDTVIARFHHGDTPEQINSGFPTLKLADIYAVIAYYLDNQDEMDAYLRQQEKEAEEIRNEIESRQPKAAELRTRLRNRLNSDE